MSKSLAVAKVERNSVASKDLQYGDLITHVNGTKLSSPDQFDDIFLELAKKDYQAELLGARLVNKLLMKNERFPRGYEQVAGYKYHIAVMFHLGGCKLALAVKSYNNKVFVVRVIENTLPSMCLLMGDAILDVDAQPVASVNDASDLIFKGLKTRGFVTMVVEQADDPVAVQYVRMALLAEKTVRIDPPMAPDVLDICEKEVARYRKDPRLKPKFGILKTKDKKPRAQDSRISVHPEVEDIPIACENNPNLLVKVPVIPPRAPAQAQQQQQQQKSATESKSNTTS